MSGTAETERLMLATTVIVSCCRKWEVTRMAPIGRCGLCGMVPS